MFPAKTTWLDSHTLLGKAQALIEIGSPAALLMVVPTNSHQDSSGEAIG